MQYSRNSVTAHLCPSLPTVTSARATCFSGGQTPQPCTMHGRIPFSIHARARARPQICLFHRYNRYIPQLRTSVVHRSCLLCLVVNFFIVTSSKHSRSRPATRDTCFFEVFEKTRGRIFPWTVRYRGIEKRKKEGWKKNSTVAA